MQVVTQRPVGAPASISSVRVRVNARGPARSAARAVVIRARAISTSGGGSPVDAAWRGNTPKQSTLPVNPDGSVDYAHIDASPISKVLTATIRKLLVEEVGGVDKDPRPWTEFGGIMNAVREVNDMDGTARDVQIRAKRVFAGILPALGIGWVPPIWKKFIHPNAPDWFSNWAFVLVFTNLFPWLMGPMEGVDHVDVPTPAWIRKTFANFPKTFRVPQAVKAERCRFLETSQCASVCVNTCKAPSQEWLSEDFGMDLHIQPNYDDSEHEPVVLPNKFPNLLVNGAQGIAVGMATNIPTHNLREVIDATIAQINDPSIDVEELIRIIPGPDFPTGGVICGRDGIRRAHIRQHLAAIRVRNRQ